MSARGSGGFTLVETLVAIVILVIGFLALDAMHVGAFRANGIARRRSLATILAYEQIERFHRLGIDNVTNGTNVATVDGRTFDRSWSSTANGANSKTVQVSISWSDQWGAQTVTIPGVIRR